MRRIRFILLSLQYFLGDWLKKWEMSLVTGIFFFAIGAIVVAWGFQAAERINIEQVGNEIIATLDPTFIVLFMFGLFLVSLGIGGAASTYTIYKLEKQLSHEESPIALTGRQKFCRYCGVENKDDAVFCVKCGKNISET